ncbi:reactive chlorine-specific transcriptional regulator RclR [Citrobacter freundii]|uniref:reactive chlorine-specific transcriptional regulator RclR n=1 Tax=Citrobacter freundii TaxID=546 RepID=UPI0019025C01|nr:MULTISPECIES: reactive chlorine-specific transcriptional regulator RclR [Citrobacter freundii complex]MBJ9596780.1 AraC family transcriptional regulator [Citrobacter werkmanii]MBJ9871899.1 AraC family transcriptional regulator [Citrobacter werkmanii]MDK2362504.1 reactive chlorine-specific transcriptional regulator RclR [Citrobacter freundii]HAU4327998.1 AraC family transcriptional regulator [Citrobacter freundii]HEB0852873.1 AraC family transcriptional regulator [Citrobacter freundii]
MDTLSRLLMLNDPQGSIDKNCLLSRDWQLPHAAGELSVIRWHTVTQGAAQLDMPDGTSFTLRAGSIVILAQNSAHRLCQSGEEQTHIVCGSLRLPPSSRYFLTTLPEALILAPDENSHVGHWLRAMIALLQEESSTDLPGSDVVCSQQCATLFTLAVRQWLTQATPAKNVLSLLLHPRLGGVVFLMLESPAHPWTVEELAQRAHMSRASFAQLFREVSNSTPLAVLTTLRLQFAAQMLSRGSQPLIVIAESVGYASESSFHKVFLRQFGCTPGEYRKRVKALES